MLKNRRKFMDSFCNKQDKLLSTFQSSLGNFLFIFSCLHWRKLEISRKAVRPWLVEGFVEGLERHHETEARLEQNPGRRVNHGRKLRVNILPEITKYAT